MSFLRSTGPGAGDGNEPAPSVRPRFSVPAEAASQSDNLLTQVRPEEPRETAPPPLRDAMAFERDSRSMATAPEKCANVIAVGAKWKGSLNVADSVRIDGQVSGDIEAKGTIHISEGAEVDAKIKAAYIVICGSFKGQVRCLERLELLPKSKVQGEIVTKLLNVHEGATVDGSISMSTDKLEAVEAPKPEAATNGARVRAGA
ncbi:MAG TPA: polymer-forming cytoskeletal protein [Dehalococcoidia bacterium]